MKRRNFITLLGGAAAWPLAARAQQMPVIGFLSIRSPEADAQLLLALRRGLRAGGFVESRNVALEYRYAQGQPSRLPSLASELVRREVAVIVTTGGAQAALAAKSGTTRISIVFSVGADPVKVGLVPSLNRPGGNLTGVTTSYDESAPKRLGLLREILPKSTLIAVLVNPADPITANNETNDMRGAARLVGQQTEFFERLPFDQQRAARRNRAAEKNFSAKLSPCQLGHDDRTTLIAMQVETGRACENIGRCVLKRRNLTGEFVRLPPVVGVKKRNLFAARS